MTQTDAWTQLLSTPLSDNLRTGTPLPENWLAAIPELGCIMATGEDSQRFLHSQLCNDLRPLNTGQHQLTGYLQPKGRLLALFRLQALENGYLLICPREIIAPTLQRLRLFVLRSKVSLEDASDDWHFIAARGAEFERAASEPFGELDIEAGAGRVLGTDQVLMCQHPEPAHRHWLWGLKSTPEQAQQLQALLDTSAFSWLGAEAWQRMQIEAGLPQVLMATREHFIPQMLNLHLVQGLSFSKGCYPGQEIVARSQYLGSLKRRTQRYTVASKNAIDVGSAICAGGDKVGEVIAAAPLDAETWQLLAVVKISAESAPDLQLAECQEARLSLASLPYSFDPQ